MDSPYFFTGESALPYGELTAHPYCEPNSSEVAVQCTLITKNTRRRVDPDRLPYTERMKWKLHQFCFRTSCHGVPMLGRATNRLYRLIWLTLLMSSCSMFGYQASRVIEKYRRFDKITDIQLNYELAPFPAITVCSLNPYLSQLLKDVEAIKKILNSYNAVMLRATRQHEPGTTTTPTPTPARRAKRQAPSPSNTTFFEPAYADCICEEEEESCSASTTTIPTSDDNTCMCAFDRDSGDAWPCYYKVKWIKKTCAYCDLKSYCTAELRAGYPNASRPCFCQTVDPFCVALAADGAILNVWEYYGVFSEEEKVVESLGFQNMSDEVAIVTKAKENIIFAMSELTEKQRIALSIEKRKLIQRCSFNGISCDIDKDFKIIADPTYGNCFTYNHRRNDTKSSIRAGSMHGYLMKMVTNTSEYLTMTEAVGVRITIHEKDEVPFPDTFGLYAPTGYVSSFGMKLSRMSRLPAPFGDCRSEAEGSGANYIYKGYRYSTEGCYRSCFQELVVKSCGCGDPRFPVLPPFAHCEVFNPVARKCLEEQTTRLGHLHSGVQQSALESGGNGEQEVKCHCQQPCEQSVYAVSYSAANWPSHSLDMSSIGKCEMGEEKCKEYFQENGAVIEVFYEQLNFEMLTESEAYGIVKMLADFGGQLGLWGGTSFLTLCEFICLCYELLALVTSHNYQKVKLRRLQKQTNL